MTPTSSLMPPDMRLWLTSHEPDLDDVQDVSWDRDDRKVWRVRSARGVVYVKRSSSPAAHEREIRAYRHAYCFAPTEVPRLLAADAEHRLIMTSAVPGVIVRDSALPAADEPRVHQAAGGLLRRWHELAEPVPAGGRAAVAESADQQGQEAAMCLERIGRRLTAPHRAMIKLVASELPRLMRKLPVAWLHGDFQTRNWLWDNADGSLGVIDFELAGHGVAVTDLVWLHGKIWLSRPDLRKAFLAGYGRELSDTEQSALSLLTARLAVSYLTTGLTQGDPGLVTRGRGVLDELTGAE